MSYNIYRYLEHDEEILWEGMPNVKLFHLCDVVLIPASILCTGYPLLMSVKVLLKIEESKAMYNESYAVNLLFGMIILIAVVCAAASFYFIIGRLIVKVMVKLNTTYYVTNRKIIIVENLVRPKIRNKYYSTMGAVEYKEKINGRSMVKFGESPILSFMLENSGMYNRRHKLPYRGTRRIEYINLPPAFYDIDDAETVYNLVTDLWDKHKTDYRLFDERN